MENNLLKIIELFELNNRSINKQQAEKLFNYYNLLIDYNSHTNLTKITEFEEVIVKHFIDSCVLSKFIEQNASICDIGAGAGFPSIPLKIIRPDIKMILIDSLNKRINFLNLIIDKLNLDNITAIHTRVQEFAQNNREKFDYTTARAVAPLNILLEYCIPITKINGKLLAMKSLKTNEEINNSHNALKLLNCKILNIENYSIQQFSEKYERTIIEIQKLSSTDKKYPRLKNLIKDNPL